MVINHHKAVFEVRRDATNQQEEQERLLEQASRHMKNAQFQLLGSKFAVFTDIFIDYNSRLMQRPLHSQL
jgi:hypothetical protein